MRNIITIVIVISIVYFLVAFADLILSSHRLNYRADELRWKIERLRQENTDKQERAAYLQTDPAIEELARQELGLVREGETAVVIVNPRPAVSATGGPSNFIVTIEPNWRRWWRLFSE